MHLDPVPPEIITQICSFMDNPTICAFSTTCKKYRNIYLQTERGLHIQIKNLIKEKLMGPHCTKDLRNFMMRLIYDTVKDMHDKIYFTNFKKAKMEKIKRKWLGTIKDKAIVDALMKKIYEPWQMQASKTIWISYFTKQIGLFTIGDLQFYIICTGEDGYANDWLLYCDGRCIVEYSESGTEIHKEDFEKVKKLLGVEDIADKYVKETLRTCFPFVWSSEPSWEWDRFEYSTYGGSSIRFTDFENLFYYDLYKYAAYEEDEEEEDEEEEGEGDEEEEGNEEEKEEEEEEKDEEEGEEDDKEEESPKKGGGQKRKFDEINE